MKGSATVAQRKPSHHKERSGWDRNITLMVMFMIFFKRKGQCETLMADGFEAARTCSHAQLLEMPTTTPEPELQTTMCPSKI